MEEQLTKIQYNIELTDEQYTEIEELAGLVGDSLGYGFAGTVDMYNTAMDAVLRRAEVLDANK